jgi:hypothetical protein
MSARMTPKQAAAASDLHKALVLPVIDDQLAALRRLARRLAWEIDENPQVGGRAVAVLSVQLRATLAEIAKLAPLEQDSPEDVIAARRAERARCGEPVSPSHAAARGGRSHG